MDERAPRSPVLPWRTRPFPVDWALEFGRPCDLHLEIGFGDGRYTVRRALDEPAAGFVGLEISSASVQRALRRLRREGVPNVRLAKAGAQFALRHLFAEHALSTVVVNFPDPWPKERHTERRLLQRSFFRLAASRLRPGGAVRLATDHPVYLAFALAEAREAGSFQALETAPPAAVFETKYALKWKAQGKPLHYVEFRYDGSPAAAFPHLERATTMPHALFTGTLPPSAPFAKVVLPYGEGHVILHEVASSFGPPAGDASERAHTPAEAARAATANDDGSVRPRWWVRASVDEPDIRQHLLVLVQQRDAREVIVRLEPFGDPVITPTVRGAVHAVVAWLEAATDLRLRERNY